MAKTATEFLSELAQRELVPPKIVESLRRQVGGTIKPISAATIARLLVEKGHLTAVQAEKLLGGPLPQAKRSPPPSSLPETRPMDSDLGLVPLEEISVPGGQSGATAAKPADATTALEPLDLGLIDLVPLDEPKPAAPVKKMPPKQPAASPPLEPLSALTPLTPLDALQPLASPLTPTSPQAQQPRRKAAPTLDAPQLPVATPLDLASPLAPAAMPTPAARPARPLPGWLWIGGAVAIALVLVVAGGLAVILLRGDKGPDPLELAEQDYKAGRFAEAAQRYDDFLAGSPRHEQAGLARVRRGMARLMAAKGSGENWPAVSSVASEVLSEIGGEERLADIHIELAPLLTEMAVGLARRAEEAQDDAPARLEDARRALALADNGRYVPGTLRDWKQLAEIAESLAVVERRQQARQAITQFTKSAGAQLDAGDITAFLAEREQLLAEYPELARDPMFVAAASSAAEAAAAAVQPLTELPQPQTSERDSTASASAVIEQPPLVAASASGGIFVARAGRTIWALDRTTGKALWRREVADPIDPVPAGDDSGLLIADAAGELLCIARQDGNIRWRSALASPVAWPPLVSAGRVTVTTTAGRIFTLDPRSGDVSIGCQLPLPAGTSAAAGSSGKLLYQLAGSDLLFLLSVDGLKGQSAAFVGHALHSVHVPPLVFPGRLVVVECRSLDKTVLHALALDDAGLPRGKRDELKVAGQILTPPVVFGDRLIIITDAGLISQFQVPAGDAPLKRLGEVPAASSEPHLTFGLLSGNRLCTTGTGIAMFDLTAGEELKPRWSRWDGDWFSSPPQLSGDAICCVRHSAGGYVAAAVKAAGGEVLWETPLAEEAAP